jgi:hypothetical protein
MMMPMVDWFATLKQIKKRRTIEQGHLHSEEQRKRQK